MDYHIHDTTTEYIQYPIPGKLNANIQSIYSEDNHIYNYPNNPNCPTINDCLSVRIMRTSSAHILTFMVHMYPILG
jgi:hypothetical protein